MTAIRELLKKTPHDKDLKRIERKMSNTKLKEEVFSARETVDEVIVGHELLFEGSSQFRVDRPITCAVRCLQTNGACRSFNYRERKPGEETSVCTMNALSSEEAIKSNALDVVDGWKLFDLLEFFEVDD